MTLTALVRELARRGVRVVVEGDRLVVRAGKDALDAELLAEMRDRKAELLELLGETDRTGDPGSRPREASDEVVPSPGQRRFWELQRLAPEPTVLNVPGAFRLSGPLDVDALEAALQDFVGRHEILRSRFRDTPDGLEIDIAEEVEVDLRMEDLTEVAEEDRDDALREMLEVRADEPLELEQGPAFGTWLIRLGPDDHALLFVAHSLVWDGWSFDILLRELAALYGTRIGAPDVHPPEELPLQFSDYAAWQQERLSEGLLERSMTYWRERMSGPVPSLELPKVAAPDPSSGYAGARSWFELNTEVVEAIRALARSERTTPYAVLLAAFNALLHRYSGVRDVLVASPLWGRDRAEVEDLVGVFANTLFLRTTVEPEMTFRDLVRKARSTVTEAVEHQAAPTRQVASLLGAGSGARSPYEALFVFQQTAKRSADFGTVTVRSIRRGTRRVAVDLTVWVREYDAYIDGAFDFRTALFDRDTIDAMKSHFRRIVSDGARRPSVPVAELELADDQEHARVAGWERTRFEEMLAAAPTDALDSAAPTRAAILDARGRPVPVNVTGEIHLATDPADPEWVGTGVRARWTAIGDLRVVGPTPDPGRGGNDLSEVSSVLRRHPDVDDATVVRQSVASGSPRIVAYVVWNTETPPFDSEIRRYLADEVAGDLVPAVTLALDAIPRSAEGRVRLDDLPNPFGAAQPRPTGTFATATEQAIANVWTELLGVEEIHPDDNFFEIGGHSLLAVESVARLERRLDTRIVARDTFFLSLREIAAGIDAAQAPTQA